MLDKIQAQLPWNRLSVIVPALVCGTTIGIHGSYMQEASLT